MRLNSCGGAKLLDIFLKTTDTCRCPSGRFTLFVDKGSSFTIINKTTNFIKTIILKNDKMFVF